MFPALLDDYMAEDNPVRAVDVFVDGLDLDSSALSQLETADRRGDAVPEAKVARLKDKIEKLKEETAQCDQCDH
ncbi:MULTISPECIES: hypothetical protein [Bradyrhizobium]|uniref:hypothetical protein n=1 Tax=Bradyrhizobium elkanii TaxID=29448 RepID=UPI0003FB2321|nr:hypothetical protein [Bradyrhizobium elkanii]